MRRSLFLRNIAARVLSYYTRYMTPVIASSYDPSAGDTMQVFMLDALEHNNEWWCYYGGQPADEVDRVFLAKKTVGNDITTGWEKHLTTGLPTVILDKGATGQWDEKEVWFRTVLNEGGNWKAWYIGRTDAVKSENTFQVGYATSTDGVSWTRYASNPILSDPNAGGTFDDPTIGTVDLGIINLKVFNFDGTYHMLYQGRDPEIYGFKHATSSDGLTWTVQQSGFLTENHWFTDFFYSNGRYYIATGAGWKYKADLVAYGLGNKIKLYSTTDFVSFTDHGNIIELNGYCERGISNSGKILQKPDGTYFLLHTYYKQQIKALGNGGEPFSSIRVAETNVSNFIPNADPVITYPSHLKRWWPLYHLNEGSTFREVISGYDFTYSTPTWDDLRALEYDGTRGIEIAKATDSLSDIDWTDFSIKARIGLSTTGTHPILCIDSPFTGVRGFQFAILEGKIRVVLSQDGSTVSKVYDSVDNIALISGITDYSDQIWVGFIFRSGVLQLCMNNNTNIATTKSTDAVMTTVNYPDLPVEIGKLQLGTGAMAYSSENIRSVSIMSGASDQDWIKLDL